MRKALTILAAAALLWACGEKPEPDPEKPMPGNVTGLKCVEDKSTESSLTFQWDNVENAVSYDWSIQKGSTTVEEGNVKTRNKTVTGLEKATEYTFSVKAVNANGTSSVASVKARTAGSDDPGQGPGPGPGPGAEYYEDFSIPAYEDVEQKPLAFPGAEGGGMYATGGRGGKIYHVTSLEDTSLEGTLRYGIEKGERPLTIVFDVAGTIALQKQLNITKGDLTIAGQTAPGDGICLKNYTFRIGASNVIIRFIRCRMGDETKTEDDAMQVMSHDDDKYDRIIIDHCSVSWCTDECASFYGMKDFTFQWNIVSESLRNSIHDKGAHGYGGIWGGNNASYHHNLLAHHDSRNPRIDHDYVSTQKGPVTISNNVVYNWKGNTCYGGESSSNHGTDYRKYNFFNNYYKPGPVTPSNHIWFLQPTTSCSNCGGTILPGHFYMDGNVMHGHSTLTSDNWKAGTSSPVGVYISESNAAKIKETDRFATGTYQSVHSAQNCLDPVLAYAGASFARDAIDARIARETKDGTSTYQGSKLKDENGKDIKDLSKNGLIDTQTDVDDGTWVNGWPVYGFSEDEVSRRRDSDSDGMPDWFEEQFGLGVKDKTDAAKTTLDKYGRYTNLEMYLHFLVKDIIAAQNAGDSYMQL